MALAIIVHLDEAVAQMVAADNAAGIQSQERNPWAAWLSSWCSLPTMNPSKVERATTHTLTDLPNVGPSVARDLEVIGIRAPKDLEHRDPFELFERLCEKTGVRHDPCVLDIFMSITDFMSGNPPQPWWAYTGERKQRYGGIVDSAHM